MQKEALAVLGLFSKRDDSDLELLPPPPPFPDIEPTKQKAKEKGTQKKGKEEQTKIVLKHRENVNDILAEASRPEGSEPEDFLSMDIPKESISVDELLQDGDEIEQAINDAKQPKKTSSWKKLFAAKKRPVEQASLELPADAVIQDIDIPQAEEKAQSPIEGIMKNINVARQQLENFDLNGAKETYVEVMKLYRMMTRTEQEKVYEIIQELYEERKSAEKLPRK